jgi:hypothetical protein
MSRDHQQWSQEDYNMENSIALRDQGIIRTQNQIRQRSLQNMSIGEIYPSTRQEESYGQSRRWLPELRESSPYATLMRQRFSTQRPSARNVMDNNDDTHMDIEECPVADPFAERTGRELQGQEAPIVQQLSKGL